MNTKPTSANLAIVALARSIAVTCEAMTANAIQADDAARTGEINGAVGALMAVRDRLASLQPQLDAVLALHRWK
jgi:hypothetical protein